jgi:hypothetical protein
MPAGSRSPGKGQPVAHLAGGVHVAAAQELAEQCVIEGGVEVAGQDARAVTRRGQRGQLTAPPGRGGPGPGRLGRRRVDAGQLHHRPGRKDEPGGVPRGRGPRGGLPAAQRVTGVDAPSRALRYPVREKITQSGPLEPGCRIVGEFLNEQHVRVLGAGQLDQHLGRGPAGEQIGRQHPQHGPRDGRLTVRYRARAHRRGQGRPGTRGRGCRAPAAQQQRADPRSRGYLRGERHQRHSPCLGEPQAVSARQPGSGPAGQHAGHSPLHAS